MTGLWSKIARGASLIKARVHYEYRRERMSPADVAGRLRPDVRSRLGSEEFGRSFVRAWLNEAPARVRCYRPEYAPADAGGDSRRRAIHLFERIVDVSDGIDWHRDPVFGVRWPKKYVRALSDYRRGSDLVLLWHLNKMMFLLGASYAYRVTSDETFARWWVASVDSWIEQNPAMVGMNWRSPLEAGTRLAVWSIGLHELAFTFTFPEKFLERMVASVIQQAEFLAGHFSFRDTPNNHLVGEAALLYFVGVMWPVFESSPKWKAQSEAVLRTEIARQVLPDGMHYENSFNYHAYVLDFLLVYLYACGLEGRAPDAAILTGTTRLATTLLAFRSPSGRVPRFGDDSMNEFLVLRALDDIERRRFVDDPTLAEIVRPDIAEVLAGADWGKALLRSRAAAGSAVLLEDSGFAAIPGKSSHLVYAAGPTHRREFSNGHLHSDAGSFELELDGEMVFVDPGTYLYGYDAAAREYFKSARAHNTLTIDGRDPLTSLETFKWDEVRRARVTWFQGEGRCRGVGSARVMPSAGADFVHNRIILQIDDAVWLIVDHLEPAVAGGGATVSDDHRADTVFHTPLGCDRIEPLDETRVLVVLPRRDGQTPTAVAGRYALGVTASTACRRTIVGDRNDHRSWVSRSYGLLEFGTTIEFCAPFSNSLTVVHTFTPLGDRVSCSVPASDPAVIEIARRGGRGETITVGFDPLCIEFGGEEVVGRLET